MNKNPLVSFLILDYKKELETIQCLESIKKHANFPHKIIYLDNGGKDEFYPDNIYRDNLCDVIIRKKNGIGGGFGQTDLIRFCDTEYFCFVQNDQFLQYPITEDVIYYFISLLNKGYHCVDLNGDQSGRGIWTDRAHFMRTDFFNSLGPFPNGGPGYDGGAKWNEQYLQEVFEKNNYQIAHIKPTLFVDNGVWSIRESGDGIFKHRCDKKELFIIKQPTYLDSVYPPLNESEKNDILSGNWPIWGKDQVGRIPEAWKAHSFKFWA